MSNFSVYMIGSILVAAGLAYAAFLLGAAPQWIFIGVLVILGLGIMGGVKKTKRKEPSDAEVDK
jgi:xanthine/uracil/vitamin C permease (AzgA family)